MEWFLTMHRISECSPMEQGAKVSTFPGSNCKMTGSPEPVKANSTFWSRLPGKAIIPTEHSDECLENQKCICLPHIVLLKKNMMGNKEIIQSSAKPLTAFSVLHILLSLEDTAMNKGKAALMHLHSRDVIVTVTTFPAPTEGRSYM